jgi:hypothetical protein
MKKEPLLDKVILERELWNAALRCPPPYKNQKKYTRKKKHKQEEL